MPKLELKNEKVGLQATLTWGSHEATIALNERGRATFPEFHLDGVLDEDESSINENLVLTLACCAT